jgi:hypothetical protein
MATTIIQLPGSTVSTLSHEGEHAAVRLDPAQIVKSQGIAGVDASTLWTQAGLLRIEEAEREGEPPPLPAVLVGGSLEAGGYRYVDMVPVPLPGPGYAQLRLVFAGGAVVTLTGTGAALQMEGTPRYVRHLQDTQPPG